MFKDLKLFITEFRNNWISTGAILPSSSSLAKAIVAPLQRRSYGSISVLEVGAGTGAFTVQVLKWLRPGDQLDIYELNPKFYAFLVKLLSQPGLCPPGIQCRLFNSDCRNLEKGRLYDFIISGLPLNNFDSGTVSEIFRVYLDHLRPEGTLSYFEYTLLNEIKLQFLKPPGRQRALKAKQAVQSFVRKYQFSSDQVWWNFPPARARHCRKGI
jgi:phosphatidylethanolamine/phosphatidyl-N-methylethanolamine N-methyltransferase